MNNYDKHTILFMDGQCVLCHNLFHLINRLDWTNKLYYSTLQGDVFKELFKGDAIDSVQLYHNGKFYNEDKALIKIFQLLPSLRLLLPFVLIIPFKNRLYKYIAKKRYKLFGLKDTCSIGNPKTMKTII